MTLNEIERAVTDSIDLAQKYLDDMEIYGELTIEYELCQKALPHSHRITLYHDNMELVACEYMMDVSFFTDISLKEQLTIEKFVKNYMVDLLRVNDIIRMVTRRSYSGNYVLYTLKESKRRAG
jgi:hypothetical protein